MARKVWSEHTGRSYPWNLIQPPEYFYNSCFNISWYDLLALHTRKPRITDNSTEQKYLPQKLKMPVFPGCQDLFCSGWFTEGGLVLHAYFTLINGIALVPVMVGRTPFHFWIASYWISSAVKVRSFSALAFASASAIATIDLA